jgi:RNA methyltransferase, TrmH family
MSAQLISVQNPRVKAVCQLHQRKYREESGQILIEGRHPVEEALASQVVLQEVFLREDEPITLDVSCPITTVSEAVMAKMATTDSPPPILAVAEKPQYQTASLIPQDNAPCFILGLMALQDPGNIGTLIRSACAFGVTGICNIGSHVDPYQPKVIRASAGLVFRLPIVNIDNTEGLTQFIKANPSLEVWGTDVKNGTSYREVTYGNQTFLLLGAEGPGLPPEIFALMQSLHIPMASQAESLNVGIAGAIILAEAYQQRLKP